MSWAQTIKSAGTNLIWRRAWRRAQNIRAQVEKITEHFFQEMVTVGVDVEGPPDLGAYTPVWAPLSDDWADRKGSENFYFYKGDLERALLRKSTQGVFGRPQVFLHFDGLTVKVNAGVPPGKYQGSRLTNMTIRVVPFPRAQGPYEAELLVAGENPEVYGKLTGGPHAPYRGLVTPFVEWYTHVKIRNAIRNS